MGLPIGAPCPSHLLPPSSSFEHSSNSAMASGVKLSDAVKHAYDDIKKHQKYLYAIFVIKDGEILVEKTVTKQEGSYETFLKDLSVKDEAGKDLCRLLTSYRPLIIT